MRKWLTIACALVAVLIAGRWAQRAEPPVGEYELHANGDAARSQCAQLPGGHHQPPESDDVRQPESEPGEHRLRAHHERDSRFATVHPIRDEVHL